MSLASSLVWEDRDYVQHCLGNCELSPTSRGLEGKVQPANVSYYTLINWTAKLIQTTLMSLSCVFPAVTALTTPFTWDALLPISTVISCPSFEARLSYQLQEAISKTPARRDPSFLWTPAALLSVTLPRIFYVLGFFVHRLCPHMRVCLHRASQTVKVGWVNWGSPGQVLHRMTWECLISASNPIYSSGA